MVSRRGLRFGLCCCAFVFVAAACQAFPGAGAIPTDTVRPNAVVDAAASESNDVVWARIPYCACLDGIATDNVSAALERAQLAGTVKPLSPTDGWLYFIVAFDPQSVSPEQIGAAIVAGGGEVMAGPP